MATKIFPAGLILAARVVQGTNFGKIFCQNQSRLILWGTNFGVTEHRGRGAVVGKVKEILLAKSLQRN